MENCNKKISLNQKNKKQQKRKKRRRRDITVLNMKSLIKTFMLFQTNLNFSIRCIIILVLKNKKQDQFGNLGLCSEIWSLSWKVDRSVIARNYWIIDLFQQITLKKITCKSSSILFSTSYHTYLHLRKSSVRT